MGNKFNLRILRENNPSLFKKWIDLRGKRVQGSFNGRTYKGILAGVKSDGQFTLKVDSDSERGWTFVKSTHDRIMLISAIDINAKYWNVESGSVVAI